MKKALVFAAFAVLLFAGVASAHVVSTLWLKPGHCTKIAKTKVCARNASSRTVTSTHTSTVTNTVTQTVTQTVTAPPPCTVTKNYSGPATTGTLEPVFTTCQNEVITVTSTALHDVYAADEIGAYVYAGVGTTPTVLVLPPGNHQFFITANGSWTVSIGS